jgi:hypothetical protein
MVIKNIYSPAVGAENSGEALIFRRGVGHLLDEIRQAILQSTLLISPRKTSTKSKEGPGVTGNPELADRLNKGLGSSLLSLGWGPRKAPGAASYQANVDWFKSVPTKLSYGPTEIGIGLEAQFGNNFQFEADLKRLSEAVLAGHIVAGVSVVASDELAEYKADRGASFSNAREKLDRFLGLLTGVGAAIVPGFLLIGISHDGFTSAQNGSFQLSAPVFDSTLGILGAPARFEEFGTASGDANPTDTF